MYFSLYLNKASTTSLKHQDHILDDSIATIKEPEDIKILAYYWNPNGTNDIELFIDGDSIGFLDNALFGLDIAGDQEIISIETALKYIACSPLDSKGNRTLEFLAKHFGWDLY